MIAPATSPVSVFERTFTCSLAVLLGLVALAIPVALFLGMLAHASHWLLALWLALIIGVVLDVLIVWLLGPLVVLAVMPLAAAVTMLLGVARFACHKLRTH